MSTGTRLRRLRMTQAATDPAALPGAALEPAPESGAVGLLHAGSEAPRGALRDRLLAQAEAAAAQGLPDAAAALLQDLQAAYPDHPAAFHRLARLCASAGRFAQATAAWRAAVARFPDAPEGYVGLADSLTAEGDAAAADATLRAGAERLPLSVDIALEHARQPELAGDWAAAAARWERVRERFPLHPLPWTSGAEALRRAGQWFEADRLLLEGAARHNNPLLLAQYAGNAERRRDWAEAALRWAHLRAVHPEQPEAYLRGARALRLAGDAAAGDALLHAAAARWPQDAAPLVELAWLAHHAGDWPEALARWQAVRARFPDLIAGHAHTITALRAMRRWDAAEAAAAAALARFPGQADILREAAQVSFDRERWDEAIDRFARLRAAHPADEHGHLGGSAVLRVLERFAAQGALLDQAVRHASHSPHVWLEHAEFPVRLKDPAQHDAAEALRRLAALRQRFPGFEPGWLSAARVLAERGRAPEAAALLAEAARRLPDSVVVARELAVLQAAAGDAGAVARLRALLARAPDDPETHLALARALLAAGPADAAAVEEAELVLAAALARFPDVMLVAWQHADAAERRGDWAAAVARWRAAARRFPFERELRVRLHTAEIRVAEIDAAVLADADADADAGAPAAAATPDGGESDAAVAARFLSLGGRPVGCEFGLFQRAAGIEPLDLLRWTEIAPAHLIAALDEDFAGVGEPEHTELVVSSGMHNHEYISRDRRWGMAMHTFVSARDVPEARMFAQVCARLRFLRRKLLADLAAGAKICVYRTIPADMDDATLLRLLAALRRHGDNTLLYPRLADAAHPAGTVTEAAPGLLIGALDRFGNNAAGKTTGANTEGWAALCRAASALRPPRPAPAPAAAAA